MITKVKIQQVPEGSMRRIIMPVIDQVECYECDSIVDIINDAAHRYPLEIFPIAQTHNGTTQGYFLVGLAMPSGKDKFDKPLFFFTKVKDEQYDRLQKFIYKYKRDKTILWTPDGNVY